MRIIAGERRGAKLEAVPGLNTRPTADRVKEGLFNIIQMDIDSDTIVLDAFAGTGALGLEAAALGKPSLSKKIHRPLLCCDRTSQNAAMKTVPALSAVMRSASCRS